MDTNTKKKIDYRQFLPEADIAMARFLCGSDEAKFTRHCDALLEKRIERGEIAREWVR